MQGESLRRKLRRRVRFIAPVHVLTELSEMEALASAARGVWLGERKAMAY